MKYLPVALLLYLFAACSTQKQVDDNMQEAHVEEMPGKTLTVPESVLEDFLDSVHDLSLALLARQADYVADSLHKTQQDLAHVLSTKDFEELKRMYRDEGYYTLNVVPIDHAIRFLPGWEPDSTDIKRDYVSLTLVPFDSSLNEFALYAGPPFEVYFYKNGKAVAKHYISFKNELNLDFFTDADGHTVVYYKYNLGTGSGIWQFNYFFYKYMNNRLVPVLNMLENGNLNGWGTPRNFWLETHVVNSAPVTLKFIYHFSLDTVEMVNDSAEVVFTWDSETQQYQGNYARTGIDPNKILAYTLFSGELLFINAYYETLKRGLYNPALRQTVLQYLDRVRITQYSAEE